MNDYDYSWSLTEQARVLSVLPQAPANMESLTLAVCLKKHLRTSVHDPAMFRPGELTHEDVRSVYVEEEGRWKHYIQGREKEIYVD